MPARFIFGLQPLLDRRKRAEEEKKHLHARRQRDRDDCAAKLHFLIGSLDASTRQPIVTEGCVAVSELHLREAHTSYLRRAIAMQREGLARAQAALDRGVAEIVAAARDRRIIEKLYERRRQMYVDEAAWREETELDEGNNRKRREPFGMKP